MNRYTVLRAEVVPMVAGALWGQNAEAMHLAAVAVDVAAGFYEAILERRDEELRILGDQFADLEARMQRVRMAAA